MPILSQFRGLADLHQLMAGMNADSWMLYLHIFFTESTVDSFLRLHNHHINAFQIFFIDRCLETCRTAKDYSPVFFPFCHLRQVQLYDSTALGFFFLSCVTLHQ